MHNEVAAKGKARKKGIMVGAPGVRLVSLTEGATIKNALEPLQGQLPKQGPIVGKGEKLIAQLSEPGMMVQDVAKGAEFKDATKSKAELDFAKNAVKGQKIDPTLRKKHTKKKLLGGRELRKDSPLKIFTDLRSVQAFGNATVVDLLFGNKDRLFMWNPENFMVSPTSVTMIDNIWSGTDAAYLKTTTVRTNPDDPTQTMTITADAALAAWKNDPQVKQLAAGDFAGLSAVAFKRITAKVLGNISRKVDKDAYTKIMAEQESTFLKHFTAGLKQGRTNVLASLDSIQKKPAIICLLYTSDAADE